MTNLPSSWLVRSREASNLFNEVHSHLAEIRNLYTARSRHIVGVIEALFLPEFQLALNQNHDPYANEPEREEMLKYMGLDYPSKKLQVEVREGYTAPGRDFSSAVDMYEAERMQWVLRILEDLPDDKLEDYYRKALELERIQKARK